ncbi:hypothetical protein IX317_001113 [Fusobacterium sp. DD29]|nr:hypothetical protein [Fusobacterium sp. DD45]MBR8711073.1 hypothetical protein [Fusobacterium sp. DD28]MBR8749439.1 hypothetical protein [Fusobacterium sp. DD29]MBR8751647.1 hypothetical protein [Fusobacterium sp. DD26]MBR8761671.1 hypothetical protein [Fusobacterium sp. DD25]MBR8767711.1 hypothetical protein [Fusobacterium sp. DD43]MBR8771741.1 hypothetical protein [Fusobacterium sp. DD40]MBR8775987.1 hypothetical protein [Fusobacterium sp. DD17]MBR8798249.1 hypothetical protein [Fusoba
MLKLKRFLLQFNIIVSSISKNLYQFNYNGKIYNLKYCPELIPRLRYKLYSFNPVKRNFTLEFQGGVGMLLEFMKMKMER